MSRKVLVSHPGRQHSHRAAAAIERADLLAGYWSGVPSVEEHRGAVPAALWSRWVRYSPAGLPAAKARAAVRVPVERKAGNLLPGALAFRVDLHACRSFDRWVARRLGEVGAGAVLACEISALETFREAKRRGWVTLLDAPAIHPAAQDRWHGYREPESVHRRIVAIKEEEIELADAVVTVSEFARGTYVAAGVPAEKVLAISLGADLGVFGAGERPAREGVCRFLFAGAPIERKGFDLLVEALGLLDGEDLGFHLRQVGPRGELSGLLGHMPPETWSVAGPRTQGELAREMAAADCLVLPSRNDSFGMVVAEALAAGIPVVVSDHVGAADLVHEGVNGWIVPAGDLGALTARLRTCARSPESLRAMSGACRESAREATWESYSERFVRALEPFLERGPG